MVPRGPHRIEDCVIDDQGICRAISCVDRACKRADLSDADLSDADLTPIRDDLWAVLSACACLVGTLANARGCKHTEIPGLRPASQRASERFFLAIKPGDTPETSQFVRLALDWVEQWLNTVRPNGIGAKP